VGLAGGLYPLRLSFVFDIVGIIAGALRMPPWRFFLACWAGRTISYTAAAYLGYLWLRDIPWWGYVIGFAVLIIAALVLVGRSKKGNGGYLAGPERTCNISNAPVIK
jgi:uncharacterized membrane protein YdjX (TVP38/TMEM64 family)